MFSYILQKSKHFIWLINTLQCKRSKHLKASRELYLVSFLKKHNFIVIPMVSLAKTEIWQNINQLTLLLTNVSSVAPPMQQWSFLLVHILINFSEQQAQLKDQLKALEWALAVALAKV